MLYTVESMTRPRVLSCMGWFSLTSINVIIYLSTHTIFSLWFTNATFFAKEKLIHLQYQTFTCDDKGRT